MPKDRRVKRFSHPQGKQTSLPVTVTQCVSHCLFVDDRWQKKCRKRKRKAPELLIVFTGVGWDDSTGKGLPAAGLKVGIHEPFWTKRPCYEK